MKKVAKGARVSKCDTYRWTLTRDWGSGERVCWIMLNPSDADHLIDDPTIRRVIHFTDSWGFAGFTALNLYPFRSPIPAECKQWATDQTLAKEVQKAMKRNAAFITSEVPKASFVVAAWGNNTWDSDLVESTVQSLLTGTCTEVFCLGTTSKGEPKHPMARGNHRIPDDQRPLLWRAARRQR